MHIWYMGNVILAHVLVARRSREDQSPESEPSKVSSKIEFESWVSVV